MYKKVPKRRMQHSIARIVCHTKGRPRSDKKDTCNLNVTTKNEIIFFLEKEAQTGCYKSHTRLMPCKSHIQKETFSEGREQRSFTFSVHTLRRCVIAALVIYLTDEANLHTVFSPGCQ